jgi:hypothetical protein
VFLGRPLGQGKHLQGLMLGGGLVRHVHVVQRLIHGRLPSE